MSIVKMDMTEYEALKKNEALLEQLVAEKERLVGELEQSREDVKEAMKANERTVTIINRSEKHNHKKALRPTQEILDRLAAMFGVPRVRVTDFGYSMGTMDVDTVMNRIADSFFGEWVSESLPVQESISRVGFDEAKAEVQAQYKAELQAETTQKLSQLISLTEEYDKLRKKFEPVETSNNQLTSANNKLSKTIEKLEKDKEDLEAQRSNLQDMIASLTTTLSDIKLNIETKSHSGMFENKKRVQAVKAILKTLEDE